MVPQVELPPNNKTTPFFGGVFVTFFLISLWSYTTTPPQTEARTQARTRAQSRPGPTTFYDGLSLSYTIDTPVRGWDKKRSQWLARNPKFPRPGPARVIMVTGSQLGLCPNPVGDNLLLRLFKNKADYCRIHGYDIFYNNVLLEPKMPSQWAKYPIIRAAMLAHPEVEWIWWVDSGATLTDMDFKIPFHKYKAHNLVIHGWPNVVKDKSRWAGLDTRVLLIQNCQWSMDLLDQWAEFSPLSPDYVKWGPILKSIFTDKLDPELSDQTALGYLLVKEGNKWRDKIYLETEYYLKGSWVEIVGQLETVSDSYKAVEKKVSSLKSRHAEKGGESYREHLEAYVKEGGLRRPFITHFRGCRICSGEDNEGFSVKECWDGINKALNFADNQVLRNFGYFHPNLHNTSLVEPLSFSFD